MLYLGHFSFDETTEEGRFGYFTSMVEAKTPEAAEKTFRKLIKDMRKKKALFGEAMEIYLDNFIEIGAVPPTGLITWYSSYSGETQGRISTFLPHEDTGGCTSYYVYPSDRPDIAEKVDAMERHEEVPFVTFEPTAAQKRAAELKAEMERLSRQVLPPARKPFAKKHW